MTTFTNINDTSFTITWKTADYASTIRQYSDTLTHSGLKWHLGAFRKTDHVAVYAFCLGNDSNGWSANINTTLKLLKNNEQPVSKSFVHTMDCETKSWGYPAFTLLSDLNDGYIQDGMITLEMCVEIRSIYGNHPERKHNFHDDKSELSDVVLMVEDKPLYVSKLTLSCISTVFHSMFYLEKKSLKTIKLEDTKFDMFEKFLQLLYHCDVEITEYNVDSLLSLANRYKTLMVTKKCEAFLIKTTEVEIDKKLGYAEKYSLHKLQKICISSIETKAKLEEACVELGKRDKKTMVDILKKSIAMLKKENPDVT